jgi:hypothetical protein
MALSSFNAYGITELNSEISALKSKTDLLVDVSHLHKAHLHHLEEKTDATNKLLPDLLESNVWFTTKIIDAVEKKFQSVVHHHKNVIKSAQHHLLAPGTLPHNVLDEILNHTLSVARKRNMVSFVNYTSDLFQVEVSHFRHNPDTPDQLRRHGHGRTRMLHPDHGSRDLSGQIRDDRDPEVDHGLDQRTGGTFSVEPTPRASTWPFKGSGQSTTESLMLASCSRNSTKSDQLRRIGLSPHQPP